MSGRLTRSSDGMIGGVAGGVATMLNADPAIVRVAWAVLVPLTGGVALLAYIVAWVVVPGADATVVGDDSEVPSLAQPVDQGRTALLVGGGLILVGLWFLLRQLLPAVDWSLAWPAVLIGVGVMILVGSRRGRA